MKKCTKCGIEKQEEEYYNRIESNDGLNYWCKSCCLNWGREWNKKHPGASRARAIKSYHSDKERSASHERRKDLKRKYGITPSDYDSILESQGGVCAICRTETAGCNRRFHVDHNHATGKVRSLLCRACNHLIGNAKESEQILFRAIEYIRDHNEYSSWT